MTYESPFHLLKSRICTEIDGEFLNAVYKVGVTVDKDELLKALQYDRGQYEKGYADGRADAVKWISVKEQLPHRHKFVIVYYGKFRGVIMSVMAWDGENWYDGSFNGDNEWITHWMPLPEPPKEDEYEEP